VFAEYDRDNPTLKQAVREVLERPSRSAAPSSPPLTRLRASRDGCS
jgi:hypothetical protein